MAISHNLQVSNWLVQASQSCYDALLSKKYTLTDTERFPNNGAINGVVIQRPNHGLAHAIRKISFIPLVVALFEQKGISTFIHNGSSISLRGEIENIQIAMLFSVTGRESEISYKDDPVRYNQFRKASSDHYEAHIVANKDQKPSYKHLVNTNLIAFYKRIIFAPHADNKCIVSRTFRIAHCLDLQRCYTKAEFIGAIESIKTDLGLSGQHNTPVTNDLKEYVTQCLTATGDQNLAAGIGRSPELFVTCSTIAKFCFDQIKKVKTPNFAITYPVVQTKPPASAQETVGTAFYEKGKSFYAAKDYPSALVCFISAARTGHGKAEYYAGYSFHYGQGTQVNFNEAFKHLKASTKYQDQTASYLPNAYYLVGMCYYDGRGCTKEPSKAKGYLQRAAELGSVEAKTALKTHHL